jgi:hypothetical protein
MAQRLGAAVDERDELQLGAQGVGDWHQSLSDGGRDMSAKGELSSWSPTSKERVRITTKFSDGTPAYQHAGAPSPA